MAASFKEELIQLINNLHGMPENMKTKLRAKLESHDVIIDHDKTKEINTSYFLWLLCKDNPALMAEPNKKSNKQLYEYFTRKTGLIEIRETQPTQQQPNKRK